MAEVWLLWERFWLRRVFADREDAEDAAELLRGRLATEGLLMHAPHVRVERRDVTPATERAPIKGVRVRQAIDEAAKDWPLLRGGEIGNTHFILVRHYLAVPHEGGLKFPAFQFQPDLREQWPGFRDALAIFRDNGWDDASIYLWFTEPQGVAEGDTPALLLRTDPDALIEAARNASAHGDIPGVLATLHRGRRIDAREPGNLSVAEP